MTKRNEEWISPIGSLVSADVEANEQDDEATAALDAILPYNDIAEEVIFGRNIKGYTQQELADLIGTSAPAISRIESGKHLPNSRTLQKLATCLDVEFRFPLRFVGPDAETLIAEIAPVTAKPPRQLRRSSGSSGWPPSILPMATGGGEQLD